jgi:hypothetical protein
LVGYTRADVEPERAMSLSAKQRGVLAGMLSALFLSIAIIASGVWANPLGYAPELSLEQRTRTLAAASLGPAFCLFFCIARLAKHRFFTPIDIDGSGLTPGSERAKLLQALLQNTLEQATLAAFAYLVWALLMPATWLSVVPMASAAFCAGRLLFFARYERGASSRALGFALTAYPTFLMLPVCAARWLAELAR